MSSSRPGRRRLATLFPAKTLHGPVHQPARTIGLAIATGFAEITKRRQEPPNSGSPSRRCATCSCFILEPCSSGRLGGRHPGDHPRRGVLLRPAGSDQDHERRLGHLLALDDHDSTTCSSADHELIDLLRAPLKHAGDFSPGRLNPYKVGLELFRDIERALGHSAATAPSTTACDDMEARRELEQGPRPARYGSKGKESPGREKIYEVRADLQRRDLRGRVPHPGIGRPSRSSTSTAYDPNTRQDGRGEPRLPQGQAAVAVHPLGNHGQAVHLRGRR
jgi:hypothetical protein